MTIGTAPWGRCERCSDRRPYHELLRQKHIITSSPGENRLPHSMPSDTSALWTCDASYLGKISHASSKYWIQVNRDNTVTNKDGAPTWEDSGRLKGASPNLVDASTWTTLYLWIYFGMHERISGTATFDIGMIGNGTDYEMDSITLTGGSKQLIASLTISPTVDAGDRSSMIPYVDVTTLAASTAWWVQHVEIMKDTNEQLRRGVHIRTKGTAVVRTERVKQLVSLVVCPDCRRKGPLDLVDIREVELSELPEIPEDNRE